MASHVFRKLNAGVNWAQEPKGQGAAEDGDEVEEGGASILRKAGALLAKGSKTIPAGLVDMTRCKDANLHGPTQGVVQSLEFHPNGQLLMTAGLDKKLRLFQVLLSLLMYPQRTYLLDPAAISLPSQFLVLCLKTKYSVLVFLCLTF